MEKICKNCDYWDGDRVNWSPHKSRCHRKSPVPAFVMKERRGNSGPDDYYKASERGEFPIVDKDDWCGEWKSEKYFEKNRNEAMEKAQKYIDSVYSGE